LYAFCEVLFLFLDITAYGYPVFVLDRKREKDAETAEDDKESILCNELQPKCNQLPECIKELST
jgi:hypothetical protein